MSLHHFLDTLWPPFGMSSTSSFKSVLRNAPYIEMDATIPELDKTNHGSKSTLSKDDKEVNFFMVYTQYTTLLEGLHPQGCYESKMANLNSHSYSRSNNFVRYWEIKIIQFEEQKALRWQSKQNRGNPCLIHTFLQKIIIIEEQNVATKLFQRVRFPERSKTQPSTTSSLNIASAELPACTELEVL